MAAPEFVDFNAVASFQENTVNATAQWLFGTTTVTDTDEDWNGGTLVISGLAPDDIIIPQNFGTGFGEPSYNSATGEFAIGGVVIGIVSGGVGTTLTITFNANADSASISTLLMSLLYENDSDTPTPSRTLTVTLTDAAGNVAMVEREAGFTELTGLDNPFSGMDWAYGNVTGPTFADLDGDGDLDMVVGVYDGPLRYFENTGTASEPQFVERADDDNPFPDTALWWGAPTFVDIDGDGDQDVFAGTLPGSFEFFRNDGAAGFTRQTGGNNPLGGIVMGYSNTPAFGDLDGDGDQDMIFSDYYGEVLYYRNDGTTAAPSFVAAGTIADVYFQGSGTQRPLLFDFDRDGDLDIISPQTLSGGIDYFENIGDATNAAFEQKFGGDNPFDGFSIGGAGSIALADIDGDGVADLIIGSYSTGLSAWRYEPGGPVLPRFKLRVTPEPERQDGTTASETLQGLAIDDALYGDAGDDVLKGAAGEDELHGGDDDDSLRGEDGDDIIFGDNGADVLVGGNGDDVLQGGDGDDVLTGGAGVDRYFGGLGDDAYNVDDGDIFMIMESADEGTDTVIYKGTSGAVLGANLENLSLKTAGDILLTGNALDNIITAVGGDNVIHGMAGDDTIDGGAGDDLLSGWGDDDHLIGWTGDDLLLGGAGVDTLDGGAGNDSLDGGAGADTMIGGGGNDGYVVDDVNDTVVEDLGKGTDTVTATVDYELTANVENLVQTGSGILHGTGNALKNTITGGDGISLLYGQDGADTLYGGLGDDELYGGNDNDVLEGGDGADALNGFWGNDTLRGGDGEDRLQGEGGVDKLYGGAGADSFEFMSRDLRLSGLGEGLQRDTIFDFSAGEGDVIDLSRIDAVSATFGIDDAFTFVARFSRVAGQAVLTWNATAGTTTVKLDVDGDGRSDHEIIVHAQLTADGDYWLL